MAGPTTRVRATWVADRVTSLPKMWAIVAQHLGFVGAWQLMLVCKAARVGAKDFLKTPRTCCLRRTHNRWGSVEQVWRLDFSTLRWEGGHACA